MINTKSKHHHPLLVKHQSLRLPKQPSAGQVPSKGGMFMRHKSILSLSAWGHSHLLGSG